VIKSKRLVDHFIHRIANIADFMQFYKKSGHSAAPGPSHSNSHQQSN